MTSGWPRWVASLRYREGQGWTLKLPSEPSGPLLIRDELVYAGDPDVPPTGAVDVLTGILRGERLRPQARLSTARRGVLLRDPHGELVADVVDDAVSVLDGRAGATRLRELEVEATPQTPPGLVEAVVARLREAGAGAPDPTPKYLRAIRGRGAAPPELAVPGLSRSSSLADVVTRAISGRPSHRRGAAPSPDSPQALPLRGRGLGACPWQEDRSPRQGRRRPSGHWANCTTPSSPKRGCASGRSTTHPQWERSLRASSRRSNTTPHAARGRSGPDAWKRGEHGRAAVTTGQAVICVAPS